MKESFILSVYIRPRCKVSLQAQKCNHHPGTAKRYTSYMYVYTYTLLYVIYLKNHCYFLDRYEGQFKEGKPREIRRSENGKRTRLLTRDELR